MADDDIDEMATEIEKQMRSVPRKRVDEKIASDSSEAKGYHGDAELKREAAAHDNDQGLFAIDNDGEIIDIEKKKKGNIIDSILATKAGMSETKLKFEASRVGIGVDEFEKLQREGNLQTVYKAIESGKERELLQKKLQAQTEKTEAQARNTESITEKREAQTGRAAVPKGGNRLVQFGSTGYGKNPIYLAQANSHSYLREKYTPNSATGVSRSLDASRSQMARLQESVVRRPTVVSQAYPGVSTSSPAIRTSPGSGGGHLVAPPHSSPPAASVQALRPNHGLNGTAIIPTSMLALQPRIISGYGIPLAVQRLGNMGNVPSAGDSSLSRLNPDSRGSTGNSILSRLSPRRFKP